MSNRDVKLENTLLDGSRRPLLKLCDFGYSKADTDSLPKSVVGTPGYTGDARAAAGLGRQAAPPRELPRPEVLAMQAASRGPASHTPTCLPALQVLWFRWSGVQACQVGCLPACHLWGG